MTAIPIQPLFASAWLLKRTLALVSLMLCSLMAEAESKTSYKIEQMKDNVYRFTAGHYKSAFMVTDQGIIVTDPINKEAAAWLKDALAKRFKQPIRYMLYSHSHVDHSYGGDVIDSADITVVAHEYAKEDIEWTKLPTALPELTFRDELRVNLGNSWVELKYHGPNNGRGNVSMRFMPANVMYVVDWILVGRMPYRNLVGYDIHGVIRSTREVMAMPPFDLFIGGHAEAGSREEVADYLNYMEDLYAAVRDGMLKGKTLKTLQKEIQLPEYADVKMYKKWLPENIEGVYNTLVNVSYFNFRPDLDTQF